MQQSALIDILKVFSAHNVTVSSFILFLLSDPILENEYLDVRARAGTLIDALVASAKDSVNINWVYPLAWNLLQHELKRLLLNGEEWQLSATRLKASQVHEFRIDKMATEFAAEAPMLWDLLGHLLSAGRQVISDGSASFEEEDEDSELWANMDLEGIINFITTEADPKPVKEKKNASRRAATKKVVIFSMLMQSSNQKTNALETIIGVFLHACKTPEKVIEALSRLGISISINAIHSAITSLSAESANNLRKLGQTHLVAYAYDNFDVDLKTSIPTAQRSTTTLKHLTSAIVFPLEHGITLEDMKCSEELWRKSRLNPEADPADLPPQPHWKNVFQCIRMAHPVSIDSEGLSRHQKFNAWKFLHDLCTYGPEYFGQFRNQIPPPDVIDQIPLIKTQITPARAMDLSNSTVSGNISTIQNLMEQGGVVPPT
ncbi:hypothetical protein M378DRAFT_91384, partial [Amanita muscaria Koide BX008]